LVDLGQGSGVKAIEPPRPIDPHSDQSGLAQIFEMLGDVWLRQVEGFHEVSRRLFAISEKGEDVATSGVGYGGEGCHVSIFSRRYMPVKEYL
jgi:hypothetical protein